MEKMAGKKLQWSRRWAKKPEKGTPQKGFQGSHKVLAVIKYRKISFHYHKAH